MTYSDIEIEDRFYNNEKIKIESYQFTKSQKDFINCIFTKNYNPNNILKPIRKNLTSFLKTFDNLLDEKKEYMKNKYFIFRMLLSLPKFKYNITKNGSLIRDFIIIIIKGGYYDLLTALYEDIDYKNILIDTLTSLFNYGNLLNDYNDNIVILNILIKNDGENKIISDIIPNVLNLFKIVELYNNHPKKDSYVTNKLIELINNLYKDETN